MGAERGQRRQDIERGEKDRTKQRYAGRALLKAKSPRGKEE
jgi:hypothetical protein